LGFCIDKTGPSSANLGDGNGWVNQSLALRQDYYHLEMMDSSSKNNAAGNLVQLFRQNGPTAHTGALFLAYVYQFVPAALFGGRRTDTDGVDQRFPVSGRRSGVSSS